METHGLNLFIVDDNRSMVRALKHYLQNMFGVSVHISTFNDGESCLKNVNKETDIVILDYFLKDKNGLEILKSIKSINPKTEVIMLSSREDMELAIESFRAGAKDYVVKGPSSWKRITRLVRHILMEPIRLVVREFGVSKYMAMFLLTFVTMGIVVFFVLHIMK